MTRTVSVIIGLFMACLLVTLAVFAGLRFVVGFPWGAALLVAALAGIGAAVGGADSAAPSRRDR